MTCSKFVECAFEFRVSLAQMKDATRKAGLYSVRPYGPFHVYPYVWTRNQDDTIRLDMGQNETGQRFVAMFRFEHSALRPGVLVHVSVWLVVNPKIPDWSATFTMDTRLHAVATNHFKGLLGIPSQLELQIVPPPPEEGVS